ncbi:hypothetical protein PUP68_19825 [Pseudomonas chlororaphis]|uniref:hypothetical protein n=1 Tax=Pseudomonas chlororaphis TaxID=587753 RepID=UPI0018D4BCBE|nr:hypothetical protein [Pseudomonas chlororaphis]WDG77661.1 hypothetical protein PUP77_25035 [Pseudomonas chlororaphis]WDG83102.1 hypothetical protein PUP68_19825 [Pseudomonas chlororaphis]WDG89568.1 hypothetical protein PUP49_19960 [Pseudomonas chlororaphis]
MSFQRKKIRENDHEHKAGTFASIEDSLEKSGATLAMGDLVAAATGYVIDPAAAVSAFKRLDAADHSIKGLMTWSINWDDGVSRESVCYN